MCHVIKGEGSIDTGGRKASALRLAAIVRLSDI